MADPYTIRSFVPDCHPQGVRIVDRMNWTGVGIAFPRTKWAEVDTLKRSQSKTAAELDALVPFMLDKTFKGDL